MVESKRDYEGGRGPSDHFLASSEEEGGKAHASFGKKKE